jgi:hypothetical protein
VKVPVIAIVPFLPKLESANALLLLRCFVKASERVFGCEHFLVGWVQITRSVSLGLVIPGFGCLSETGSKCFIGFRGNPHRHCAETTDTESGLAALMGTVHAMRPDAAGIIV